MSEQAYKCGSGANRRTVFGPNLPGGVLCDREPEAEMVTAELNRLAAERDAARAEVERLRGVLQTVQWEGVDEDDYGDLVSCCPSCGNHLWADNGQHAAGCKLHEALCRAAKGGGE